MPRQVDDAGSKTLVDKIEALGVQVHLGKSTREFLGNGKVEGMAFADGGAARRRHGRRLGRHPAARRAGPRLRPGGRPARRRRRRRRAAHVRPGHLRDRRGRLAPGHDLRPGRPRLRDGRGRRGEPHGRDADVRRRRHVDQAEADGRRRRQLRRPVRRGRAAPGR